MADQLHRQPPERIKPATADDRCWVSKDDSSAQNGDGRSPHALPAVLNRMLAVGCPNYFCIG
jgi:hypothetical protein